jgi:hypothetical protein
MGPFEALAGVICLATILLIAALVILYINDRRRVRRARREGSAAEVARLEGRHARFVWTLFLVMLVVMLLLGGLLPALMGGPKRARRRQLVAIPPLTAEGAALLVGIGGVAMLATWGMIALASRPKGPEKMTIEEARNAKPACRGHWNPPSRWPWVVYIIAIMGTSFLFSVLTLPGRFGNSLDGARPYMLFALVGGCGAGFASWTAVLMLRYRDREVERIIQRAREGETDVAIEELRALIDIKGPSLARANALGILLATRERWEEADRWLAEAERLGGRAPWLLASRALVLGKMGRGEEALALLDEARGREPENLIVAVNTCHVLAGLGRSDEAREALSHAEEIRRNSTPLSVAMGTEQDRLIAECRRLLPEAPPKEPLELDEL